MMALFICNVWRIAVAAAYVTMVLSAPDTAVQLQLPAGLIALGVATYDYMERRQR